MGELTPSGGKAAHGHDHEGGSPTHHQMQHYEEWALHSAWQTAELTLVVGQEHERAGLAVSLS